MRMSRSRRLVLRRLSSSWLGPVVAATLIAPLGLGCLSNEYRIPRDELRRLAQLPPETRGHRVRVVQELGNRRGDPVNAEQVVAAQAPPPITQEMPVAVDVIEPVVVLDMNIDVASPGVSSGPASRGRIGASTPQAARAVSAPPVRGRPASGGSAGGFNMGGCCGGGGGGGDADALVVLAVVVVGAAVIGTIALAASEGARFDGHAAVASDQPLHLKDSAGRETNVPLAFLSSEQAATTIEATVMDDEWAGLRRLDDAPLDRVGGAFRLELGTSAFQYGTTALVGPMAHIQAGGFVTRHVGIFLDLGLSGGSDCCVGTIVRHSLAIELDVMPVKWGPLHAGIFGKVGGTLAGGVGNRLTGTLGGAGVLIEFDLTSRMALILRGGANTAHLDNGWSPAGTVTAGLAIY